MVSPMMSQKKLFYLLLNTPFSSKMDRDGNPNFGQIKLRQLFELVQLSSVFLVICNFFAVLVGFYKVNMAITRKTLFLCFAFAPIIAVVLRMRQLNRSKNPCQRCTEWAESERNNEGIGWLDELPDCPCHMSEITESIKTKTRLNGYKWNKDLIMFGVHHPEPAVYSFRSSTVKKYLKYSQQCVYTKDGLLVTDGLGAGTPDKFHSPFRWFSHYFHDVIPFNWCCWQCKDCDICQEYFINRAVNRGGNCTAVPSATCFHIEEDT
eukprot:TRINITY_DN18608_c0_g1_i2.p1 TRINITY_DN18608_c0_g1~~TRINITY_DN18608_c0_g1_i2.p1  ORF type:complete len:264 (-),score=9.43 TRINITY_DN18608_c0_g1_i2:209-1000(-)